MTERFKVSEFKLLSYIPQTSISHFYHEREKIYNPVQKDHVTFLKTSVETNGECTLVEVELADGCGVGLHYHKTYSEKLIALKARYRLRLEKPSIY